MIDRRGERHQPRGRIQAGVCRVNQDDGAGVSTGASTGTSTDERRAQGRVVGEAQRAVQTNNSRGLRRNRND
nr:hypothetical protein [Corynebacterium lactis]